MVHLCTQVDYKEKAAAGGQFPRSFSRRDGGLSERDILISRHIGRFNSNKSIGMLIQYGSQCLTVKSF